MDCHFLTLHVRNGYTYCIQWRNPTPTWVYNHEWRNIKFYVVTLEGPAILGLPSLRELKLVTIHCAMQQIKCPLNSTEDLMEMNSNCFDKVGEFVGEYHIILKTDSNPVIHLPRKCTIQIKDKLKADLEDIVTQGIIRKIDEPTDWVMSIVFVQKKQWRTPEYLCASEYTTLTKPLQHNEDVIPLSINEKK